MPTVSQNLAGTPWKRMYNGMGDIAVNNTADKMKFIINESAKNPYVRRWAEHIISKAGVPAYDWVGEAKAVHNWVRDHIRYTHDPKGIEYLQTPPTLLQLIEKGEVPMGDCDDMTMLSLSLLKTLGYDVGLKITSYSSRGTYQHVYGLVRVPIGKPGQTGVSMGAQWLVSDTIKPDKGLGWEAPKPTRSFTLMV